MSVGGGGFIPLSQKYEDNVYNISIAGASHAANLMFRSIGMQTSLDLVMD